MAGPDVLPGAGRDARCVNPLPLPPSPVTDPLFASFFLGGFECSTHRLGSGRRLDMIAATRHERWVRADYARLREVGIAAARDGIRWHLIEPRPGAYDFSSVRPMLEAARDLGLQVVWDMCHYGWPDWLDIFRPAFPAALARLTAEFVALHVEVTGRAPFLAPVNEPSFFAWAGGTIALFNPGKRRRGDELKAQLARAAIAAIEAAWAVAPGTRIVHTDPLIHVVGAPDSRRAQTRAARYRELQFEAWDMIGGRLKPELGGQPRYLDILGANFYPNNQWMVFKRPDAKRPPHIGRDHALYRPLHLLLVELVARYGRPLLLAETGTEGEARAEWLRYVCDEVAAAQALGARLEGICWYPIVNHPGWTDRRHCPNGLWGYADRRGARPRHEPLADELRRQQLRFAAGETIARRDPAPPVALCA